MKTIIIDGIEYNLTPKVLFKKGDWVANSQGDVWHIDSLDGKNYQVSNGKGNYNYFPISKQDEMHLWTIEDAKPGDVIYLPNGNNEYYFFIFKGIENAAVMSFAHFYQYNDGTSKVEGTIDKLTSINDIFQPATKEQRDLLFSKMKEAGYEWDVEKKELKKIEKESAEWGDTEKQEMFIKSQKPHFWRPSDEQMKALKYVAYHLMPDTNYREEMFSLYEDLKKLK